MEPFEKQEVRHRELSERARRRGMVAQGAQRVAEDHAFADARVEKGLHAEMVARAEKPRARRVPYREGEVADEVRDAILAPRMVGMQDELRVAGFARRGTSPGGELRGELVVGLDARVGRDPDAPVEARRVTLAARLVGGEKHGVPQPSRALAPMLLGIGAAKREPGGEHPQALTGDGSPVEVHDADDSAQRNSPIRGTTGSANAAKRSPMWAASMRASPSRSIQAWASRRSPLILTPRRRRASMPRARSRRCSVRDIGRHDARYGPCRATQSTRRAMRRARCVSSPFRGAAGAGARAGPRARLMPGRGMRSAVSGRGTRGPDTPRHPPAPPPPQASGPAN